MNNNPLITIGIATFNCHDTVDSCINSALSQTWRPIEIIVFDDNSCDGTYEKLCDISLRNKEVKIFRNKKNHGIGYVRNQIINKALGEFLAFFDDDDISNKERLSLQYQRITKYEKNYGKSFPIICHSSRNVTYPNGIIRLQKTLGTNTNTMAPAGIPVALRILLGKSLKDGYGSCPTCSQMARLSTYKLVNGFDPLFRRLEDTDFCIKLSLIGAHFVGIKEGLVSQKMTLTSDKSLEIEFKYSKLLLKKYSSFINKYGNLNFCIKWQKIKYLYCKRKFLFFIKDIIFLLLKYPKETIKRFYISLKSIQINNDFSTFHN